MILVPDQSISIEIASLFAFPTPYTDETFEFPPTHLNHEEVFTYFQEIFGFDKNQVMQSKIYIM